MTCYLGYGHACNSACGFCGRCCSCFEPLPWSVEVGDDILDDLTELEARRAYQTSKDAGVSCVLKEHGHVIQEYRGRV